MKDRKGFFGSHRNPVKMYKDYVWGIAAFPNGKSIATWSYDKKIRMWKLADGKDMRKWEVKKFVDALLNLKGGKQVVSAWENAGPFAGHSNIVMALAISSNGWAVACASSAAQSLYGIRPPGIEDAIRRTSNMGPIFADCQSTHCY